MSCAPGLAISAFEPFGGRRINRSLEVQQRLRTLVRATCHVLPVAFRQLPRAVEAIAATRPALWVMLGESSLAAGLRFEARAWNRIDARLPDNAGEQPRGVRIAKGPRVRRCTLAVDELAEVARSTGVAADPSLNAGRFACNAAYYLALSAVGAGAVVFIHVPVDAGYGSTARLARGIAAAIEVAGAGRGGSRS